MSPHELIVDSFAGGGGASLGIELALGRSPDVAINHDAEAIALHRANHPDAQHYCEDVWQVDPVEATGGRPVGLMWLSPDCKHFSKAKGGKPVSKKVRGLAWVAVRWAKAVKPRVIVLENVEEFQTWGPVLKATGRPCPERRGLTFRRFCGRLRNLGYQVEWRELRACDYGAPTIRKRLFLIARCDGQPIVWPKPTHGRTTAQPWRTAAECIDWSLPCPSIFTRTKPLAENTLKRIARGIRRFVVETDRPFIVHTAHGEASATATAKRWGKGEHSLDTALPTLTASKDLALVTPVLVGIDHKSNGDASAWPAAAPLTTITAEARHALVAPFLVPRYGEREGQEPRTVSVDRPAPVVVPTANGGSLVAAFLAKHYGERRESEVQGASLFGAAPTVTSVDHTALVASTLVSLRGTEPSHLVGRSIEEPLPTIAAQGTHAAEVRAFLVAYYGTEQNCGDLFGQVPTIPTRDRFGLVTVDGQDYAIADIGMRMLAPRELYRAQGFPDSYRIEIAFNGRPLSKTAQVRMCGNSVCPPLAEAIVRANVGTSALVEEAA